MLDVYAVSAYAVDVAGRVPGSKRENTMTIKTNIDSIKLSNGRFVNVGHEVKNFGRRCVIIGSPVGVGADDSVVVQEVKGTELVAGSVWIAAPRFLA